MGEMHYFNKWAFTCMCYVSIDIYQHMCCTCFCLCTSISYYLYYGCSLCMHGTEPYSTLRAFVRGILWWPGSSHHEQCYYEQSCCRLFYTPGRPCDVSVMWYEKTISWNMKIISFHDSESGHNCPQMSLHVWMLGYQEDHGELSNAFILDFPWPLIPCSVSIFKQFVYRGYSANDPRCLVRILLHFEAQQIRTLLLSWFN